MAMQPAINARTLAKLKAQSKGNVKVLPKPLKTVFKGETFASTKTGLPILNCHQGKKIETMIKTIVNIPATRPIQLIFLCIVRFHPLRLLERSELLQVDSVLS